MTSQNLFPPWIGFCVLKPQTLISGASGARLAPVLDPARLEAVAEPLGVAGGSPERSAHAFQEPNSMADRSQALGSRSHSSSIQAAIASCASR